MGINSFQKSHIQTLNSERLSGPQSRSERQREKEDNDLAFIILPSSGFSQGWQSSYVSLVDQKFIHKGQTI